MPTTLMNLKVLLPFQIFAEKTGVSRIVAETREGSFGLLPHRLDCVAALAPGILIYETEAEGEVYVAVDEGVLVKTGLDVLVSVRQRDRRNGPRPIARVGGAGVSDPGRAGAKRSLGDGEIGKRISCVASRSFNMSDEPNQERREDRSRLSASKSARRRRASSRRSVNSTQGVWFGLGMMGLIGWSVVVPTLLGAALGIWLDKHYPGKHSWTLALLFAGLRIGCLNAWHWVAKEDKEMREEQENDDE